MKRMSSRERVLAAIRRKPVDYVPCSLFFNQLSPQQRVGHRWQFPWQSSGGGGIEYCIEQLGTDQVVYVSVGGFHPEDDVSSKVWTESGLLHKVWSTPAGEVHAAVRPDEHWPHGRDVPFFSDFIGHYVEPWLKSPADLECLRHILLPARTEEHLAALRSGYQKSKAIADRFDLATFTTIGSGLTGALHLAGAEAICIMTIDQPELVDAYLELDHRLNVRHMEIAVDLGVDVIRRNGFYESADFYSPATLERFLAKRLRKEIQTVHEGGKLIGYTIHTGIMPILDYLAGLDFDCILHTDTAFEGVDLAKINAKLGRRKSFWTGPSGTYHMWSDEPDPVRRAVREVFEAFGKTGLILTACPSVHSIMPWENTLAMIDEWKKLR